MRLTASADNGGANYTVTRQRGGGRLPLGAPFAVDMFAGTVNNGWGTANVGGVWSLTGTASASPWQAARGRSGMRRRARRSPPRWAR